MGTVAVVVGGAAMPGLVGAAVASGTPDSGGGAHPASGSSRMPDPLVAHVRDLKTGEITLFMGDHEVTYHDPQLAARLFQAAQ